MTEEGNSWAHRWSLKERTMISLDPEDIQSQYLQVSCSGWLCWHDKNVWHDRLIHHPCHESTVDLTLQMSTQPNGNYSIGWVGPPYDQEDVWSVKQEGYWEAILVARVSTNPPETARVVWHVDRYRCAGHWCVTHVASLNGKPGMKRQCFQSPTVPLPAHRWPSYRSETFMCISCACLLTCLLAELCGTSEGPHAVEAAQPWFWWWRAVIHTGAAKWNAAQPQPCGGLQNSSDQLHELRYPPGLWLSATWWLFISDDIVKGRRSWLPPLLLLSAIESILHWGPFLSRWC